MNLRLPIFAGALLLAACGGPPTPPAEAKADAPPPASAGEERPSSMAPGAGSDAAKGDPGATHADAAKPTDAAKPADAPGKNLEEVKMTKTTSAGGHYAVNVASVAGMSGDDVARALGAKFDDCYAKLFKKQTGANGKTAFDITISPKGKTTGVKLRSDDTKNAELVKCIEKVVKATEWTGVTDAKAGAKTTVEWAVAGN